MKSWKNSRGWSLVSTAIVLLVALVFYVAFPVVCRFVIWINFREFPAIYEKPVSVHYAVVKITPSEHPKVLGGIRFVLPKAQQVHIQTIHVKGRSSTMYRMTFKDGMILIDLGMRSWQRDKDLMRDDSKKGWNQLTKLAVMGPLTSRYTAYDAIYRATPSDIHLLSSPRKAITVSIQLILKAIMLNQGTVRLCQIHGQSFDGHRIDSRHQTRLELSSNTSDRSVLLLAKHPQWAVLNRILAQIEFEENKQGVAKKRR